MTIAARDTVEQVTAAGAVILSGLVLAWPLALLTWWLTTI